MCLYSDQLISPDYLSHSGRWIWVCGRPHCHIGWPIGGAGWSVWDWAARSFCMSVSFHNSSAKRDCQTSLWFWRSIRNCPPAITTEGWGSHFQILGGQLASALFWTWRDNKTISLDQEHLPSPSSRCHSHCPSSEICCGIKVTLTDITFLFLPFTFCLPNETFLLLQSERCVICTDVNR